jgi:excisionase family DNA binding protein
MFCDEAQSDAQQEEWMMAKALLSVAETAEATGLGERAVRDGVATGVIPGKRFGRLIRIPAWWVDEQKFGPRRQDIQ